MVALKDRSVLTGNCGAKVPLAYSTKLPAATGITEFDAPEGTLGPIALLATTLNV